MFQHVGLQTYEGVNSYGRRLTIEQCPRTQEEIEDMACVSYASFVGSLMYVMVCTRPNISHAVGVLSRYM
jgi:hypothetical protein